MAFGIIEGISLGLGAIGALGSRNRGGGMTQAVMNQVMGILGNSLRAHNAINWEAMRKERFDRFAGLVDAEAKTATNNTLGQSAQTVGLSGHDTEKGAALGAINSAAGKSKGEYGSALDDWIYNQKTQTPLQIANAYSGLLGGASQMDASSSAANASGMQGIMGLADLVMKFKPKANDSQAGNKTAEVYNKVNSASRNDTNPMKYKGGMEDLMDGIMPKKRKKMGVA